MNTKHLKSYAPKARSQFMEAVAKRAAHFGIYEDEIAPVSFQGSTAIIDGNAFTKRQGEQRKQLEKQVAAKGFELFIREMAYTWFNRLAALRYMELHDYLEHGFRVLSHPTNKDGLPEILDHAADVADMLGLDKSQIIEWQLAGDKQEVLYRELLLGQCHHLHSVLPFLFEAIDDATELLLPDNLTKTDSILKGLVNDIPEEDWQQIEVIGWLYQFYISEHKDSVMGKVVKSEDIPAATQLFTPNWIVKYLVQNSIGRQWLATYPDSSIKAKMEYYIEPAEQTEEVNAQLAEITPSSIDPESIKSLDPACGSGHILVEMYELLREIYLERGYRLREIPELILTKNIYGLDIDDRAAQLAGFALLMKAREDDRRIFQRVQEGSVKLNVYALQSTEGWDSASLWQALNLDGKAKQGSSGDLFAETKKFDDPTGEYAEYFDLLKYLIMSFEQAKTLGSLIQIDHQYLPTLEKLKDELLDKLRGTDPAAIAGAEQLLPVVKQAIVLAQKYDAVIANPPYMGSNGMNAALKDYAKSEFPDSKADLFAIFMERAFNLLSKNGNNAQVNMQSWMFLSSYEKLRNYLLDSKIFITMAHLGARAFGQISGEVVQTSAWVIGNYNVNKFRPVFVRLVEGNEKDKKENLKLGAHRYEKTLQCYFKDIPGNIIAYWINNKFIDAFSNNTLLKALAIPRQGLATMDNARFTREWHEVDFTHTSLTDSKSAMWFPYNKGGDYRKWYGNQGLLVNWKDNGSEIKALATSRYGSASKRVVNEPSYFKRSITWSKISSGIPSFRYQPEGAIFDVAGMSIFPDNEKLLCHLLALLNSSVSLNILSTLSPTVNFEAGQIGAIPVAKLDVDIQDDVEEAVKISKADWDSFEVSWNFKRNELVKQADGNIQDSVEKLSAHWARTVEKLRSIEERLNNVFAESYGVINEVDTKVEVDDISLKRRFLIDPNYQLIARSNLISELISFSVGTMMGRYSLDKDALVYAHSSNDVFRELVLAGTYQTFPADDDGIIPLASEDWLFEDDATARFRKFVKTVWGTEHLQENLEFVAESLCLNVIKPKKGESAMDTIRRYFSTQFFADHCKTYKKRPIYWLFSSGKEKAFECLVYLHRYNEATLSRMRTEYVTPLMGKYDHQLARKMEEVVEAAGTEQRRIEKEIKDLEKKQAELRKFDEELKHYAEMRISLDLDDGVKANYGKFGNLLANVKGIHGKAVK
jgi:type II restriction/modification system DNA methylase subunit YeeA